jgi:hypothetical protein
MSDELSFGFRSCGEHEAHCMIAYIARDDGREEVASAHVLPRQIKANRKKPTPWAEGLAEVERLLTGEGVR